MVLLAHTHFIESQFDAHVIHISVDGDGGVYVCVTDDSDTIDWKLNVEK